MIPVMILLASAASSNARAPGFPQEYLGRWGDDQAGCSEGAIHGGLTIERKEVRDGEFSGDVRRVRRKPDGSIEVVERWDVPEEGPSDVVSNYRLSKDKKSLTVKVIGESVQTQTLIRCPVPK